MQTPPGMQSDDWLYLSTNVTRLTATSAAVLSRGANDPEIVVDSIIMNESSGNAETATIRKVESGGADDATENLFTDLPLASKETLILPEGGGSLGLYLNAGDAIKGLAGNADRVNVLINYRKRR